MHIHCLNCFIEQANKIFSKHKLKTDISDNILLRLRLFVEDHNDNHLLAPEVSCLMHRLIKKVTLESDIYRTEKNDYNNLLLNLEEDIRNIIHKSDNSFETALRYALAGNIIDFGPSDSFDVFKALSEAASKEPFINHSSLLFDEIRKAPSVLYLGDNAGEIVLDKLFIETINHPNLYYAVRGSHIINDVTQEDARKVGITKIARVISNGYDAPSTLIDRCSPEFRKIFHQSEVIISKGQGNLEGLANIRDKKIFFLLMIKCQVIAEALGVPEKSVVVLHNREIPEPETNKK
jgi:uncharacterized protein with ATP-grasp and redox domains